jgi:hypothetical protein
MSNILFSKVNLPEFDCNAVASELINVNQNYWWWDEYRATSMLPLMTKGGKQGKVGSDNRSKTADFQWVSYTPLILRNWFDDYVFPWMGMKSRVMALMTKPTFANNEHIDCDKTDMGSRQHKFRIVLQGRTDTLYFVTDKGNIHAPNITGPFIMDGSWPHGMTNFTDEVKLTIAVGAPWCGNDSYSNTVDMLLKSQYNMTSEIDNFFKR